ncbi:putative inactive receptor kinase At2g26730 [Apium graveolens]|uniref:putative inactive receptor kinase At2g26730 n=1 Tax=Apium graveolens TaxID=4045 RepID=UPI003D7A72B0
MTVWSGTRLHILIHVILSAWLIITRAESEPSRDKQALLAFITQIPHADRIQWNESDTPCNWVGVKCDPTKSYVTELHLPGVGLMGPIPANTLGNLTQLRVISIRSNGLAGTVPPDFSNLKKLRSLYLQKNQFSGEFPSSLPQLSGLTRLDISTNNFTGEIPPSINNLTKLTGLFMANNKFSGAIPSLKLQKLVDLNVSNNKFNGSIPTTLQKYPQSAFSGNTDLCGGPLTKCKPNISSPSDFTSSTHDSPQSKLEKSKKMSIGLIIAIAGASAVIVILLFIVVSIFCMMKRKHDKDEAIERRQAASARVSGEAAGVPVDAGAKRTKLVFLGGGARKFEMDDLLRASADMLGKGSYGVSYKAEINDETVVAVKRLVDANVSEKDFEVQAEILGTIRHENIVPLLAFCYTQDEKLFIYDYMPAGSLAMLLHGSNSPPNWETRVRIATSAARGLAHLHSFGKIVHGNLKSSNILLSNDEAPEATIIDYGLSTFLSDDSNYPDHHRAGGYRAPEVLEPRKATLKSDVYSFGVLLLELITGKSPCQQTSTGEEGIDLPRWVQSVGKENWAAEVFDTELLRYEDVEEEMGQLLQIAMTCVATVPNQRPAMLDVVRLIEDTVGTGEPPITIIP